MSTLHRLPAHAPAVRRVGSRIGRHVRQRIRRRDQAGLSLVETLLTVALATLLLIPMLGWMQFSLRGQDELRDRNLASSDGSLLRMYFLRDVASADVAITSGDHLVGCDGSPATPLLVLIEDDRKVDYSLGDPSGPDTGSSGSTLWRRSCSSISGELLDSAALVAGLEPRRTGMDCLQRTRAFGSPGGCTQVQLNLTATDGRSTSIVASVRSDGEQDLVARITASTLRPLPGRAVVVSGATSSDPDDSELRYSWDFGDGSLDSGVEVEHEYRAAGRYTVTLAVENAAGDTATTSVEMTVANNEPVAVISAPDDGATFARGAKIEFSSDGSEDPDEDQGDEISYHWDFGDGTTSAEAEPTKAYRLASPAEGFTVTLTVIDSSGAKNSTSIRLNVPNAAPTVTILADPVEGSLPATVNFLAVVVDEPELGPAPTVTYLWDFGNGETSTAATPDPVTFHITDPQVSVAVKDDYGAVATATVTLKFTPAEIPMKVTPEPAIYAKGALRLESADNYNGQRVVAWKWQVNGYTFNTRTVDTTSVFQKVPPEYAGAEVFPGKAYPITLTITDATGATFTGTRSIWLRGADPIADLRMTKVTPTPANKPTSKTLSFNWTRPTQTNKYQIKLDCTSCTFSKTTTFNSVSSGNVTGVPVAAGTYAVRTRSYDSVLLKWGVWSEPMTVTT